MKSKHNSIDMKTVVQTYVVEETQELIYDDEKLQEWNKYIDELGLTGQTTIVKPTKSPIPFLHMPPTLVNTFSTLCPSTVNIEAYNVTPIPVEILSLVSLCKREGYFEHIKIMYDDKNPDPACIGVRYGTWYAQTDEGNLKGSFPTKGEAQEKMDNEGWTKHKPYGSNEMKYLIGRWGDVKRSFDELKQLAHKRFMASQGAELTKRIKDAQRALADLEATATERFMGNGAEGDMPF